MQLTTQTVERFRGGQMEIWRDNENCLYRGEIESIAVEDNELRVRFAWLAKREGFPPFLKKWVKDDHLDYAANLTVYSVSNIGFGFDGNRKLGLRLVFVNETIMLFPPNGDKLDSSDVEGH